ncbi:MAG: T9SS type A sorting domain-containing protein [Saprospiraceae bacterium]
MKKIKHVWGKEILILLIALCFAIGNLSAQSGWEKIFTSNSLDYDHDFSDIVISHDGHIVVNIFSPDGNLGTGEPRNVLIKMDNNSNIIWSKLMPTNYRYEEMKLTGDGGFIFETIDSTLADNEIALTKTDSLGNIEWNVTHTLSTTQGININDILEYSDGGFLFTGDADFYHYLAKVDANGNLLWYQSYNIQGVAETIVETAQHDILLGGFLFQSPSGDQVGITKTDPSGNIIWTQEYQSLLGSIQFSENPDGTIHLAVYGYHKLLDDQGNIMTENFLSFSFNTNKVKFLDDGFISLKSGLRMTKYDYEGNILWQKTHKYQVGPYYAWDIIQTSDGGFVIGGNLGNPFSDAFVLKTDSLGNVYDNEFSGAITWDENEDCLIDTSEFAFENWIISVTRPGKTFSTLSDENGNYFLAVDTGIFEVTVTPPNALWSVCENNITIDYTSIDNNDTVNFSIQAAIDCPFLEVNSSLPVLRPCFENSPYHVSWCNIGTTVAENAYLEVVLDSAITPISSTLPWSIQNGDTLIFDLGNILPNECGNFSMKLMLDCDAPLGTTYCVETHIYPDTLCIPPSSSWNGALVEVSGVCQDSVVNFQIENSGLGNMTQPGNYIIVEDAVLIMMDNFDLQSGQSSPIYFPANGSTYTLFATQEPFAPVNPYPIAMLEGCGVNGSGGFSTSFVNQFPLGDDDPFIDIDCTVATAAFDPNDKQGFPKGFGDEHFIEPNTDLEYLIRFQNTGTDTAFTVVLKDTISDLLDITTLRQGVGSHDYNLKIVSGNVLEFTFSNIMLPDSNVNEAASHGFVEFKISQKNDLPLGTIIENQAAIYFDYNPPIFTNETFHTLGLNFITVSLQNPISEKDRILVRPNPMQDYAIFELEKEIRDGLFELYDVSGKQAWQQKFDGKQFELQRNNLTPGIYFYKISENGYAINSGKLVVN